MPDFVFQGIDVRLVLVVGGSSKAQKIRIEKFHLFQLCHSSGSFVYYFCTLAGFDESNLHPQSVVVGFLRIDYYLI